MAKSLRQMILDYLEENQTLSLATSDGKIPWAATAFYAFDKDLNLYFMSAKDARHSREIAKNPTVACAINEKWEVKGGVKGLQIQGKAEELGLRETTKVLPLFHKRFSWAKKFLSSPKQILDKAFKGRLYKITPTKIFLLDEETFGRENRQELKL